MRFRARRQVGWGLSAVNRALQHDRGEPKEEALAAVGMAWLACPRSGLSGDFAIRPYLVLLPQPFLPPQPFLSLLAVLELVVFESVV